MFSSVTLRLVQRFAKRRGLRAAFQRLEKAPGKLFEHVLEVGKVAFDRLKHKDLSYFELEEEHLSPEAVELGFLEHVQATSLSEVNQCGFRHLTVQEYLAALYACSEVMKKAGDVRRLAEELGCGPEAGHLNTFWVFVAGLLDSSRHEELFGAIAGVDMETQDASDIVTGSSSAGNAQMALVKRSRDGEEEEGRSDRHSEVRTLKEPLPEYRFLLLLHCYDEATIGSTSPSKLSASLMSVLNNLEVHGSRTWAVLSNHDTSVLSRTIARHSDVVEKVDLSSLSLDEEGVQRILPALSTCTRLKQLHVDPHLRNYRMPTRLGSVLSRNSKSLEVLTLSSLLVEGGIFDGAEDELVPMQQLKRLELWYVNLTPARREYELGSCLRYLPALRECILTQVHIPDSMFTVVVAPALQMCKHLQTLVVQLMQLTGDRMSAFASILISLPQLKTLKLGHDSLKGEVYSEMKLSQSVELFLTKRMPPIRNPSDVWFSSCAS